MESLFGDGRIKLKWILYNYNETVSFRALYGDEQLYLTYKIETRQSNI